MYSTRLGQTAGKPRICRSSHGGGAEVSHQEPAGALAAAVRRVACRRQLTHEAVDKREARLAIDPSLEHRLGLAPAQPLPAAQAAADAVDFKDLRAWLGMTGAVKVPNKR